MTKAIAAVTLVLALPGCAGLQFYDIASADDKRVRNDLISFYEADPAVLVSYGGDCSVNVSVISVPGRQRFVRMKPGFGSAKLGVSFFNSGTLASVNQETDSKVPDSITAVGSTLKNLSDASLFSAQSAIAGGQKAEVQGCQARADLYPILDGKLSDSPRSFAAASRPNIIISAAKRTPHQIASDIKYECRSAIAGEPTGLPGNISAALIQFCEDQGLK